MVTGTILAILFFFFGNRMKGEKLGYFLGDKFKNKIKIPKEHISNFEQNNPNAQNIHWYGHANNKFEVFYEEDGIKKSQWFDEKFMLLNFNIAAIRSSKLVKELQEVA